MFLFLFGFGSLAPGGSVKNGYASTKATHQPCQSAKTVAKKKRKKNASMQSGPDVYDEQHRRYQGQACPSHTWAEKPRMPGSKVKRRKTK